MAELRLRLSLKGNHLRRLHKRNLASQFASEQPNTQARHLRSQATRRAEGVLTHSPKQGEEFSPVPTTFDVYHRSHRTLSQGTLRSLALSQEPYAPEEHSSESGSYEAGENFRPTAITNTPKSYGLTRYREYGNKIGTKTYFSLPSEA